MNKPIIAVDIDDVLVPHFQDLITWHNQTYGTKLSLSDNGNEDLTVWGADTGEAAVKRVHQFFDSQAFLDARPFLEAKASLGLLGAQFDLVVVTARDTIIEKVTRDWLAEHFTDMFEGAHFTSKYSLEGKRRQKSEVLKEVKAEYLIDDSLDNILAAVQVGLQGVLFGDYPWNRGEVPLGVVRCKDWPAVVEYFRDRA